MFAGRIRDDLWAYRLGGGTTKGTCKEVTKATPYAGTRGSAHTCRPLGGGEIQGERERVDLSLS